MILNPPRGGVAPEVVGALLREPPARIIYVSCDPATLARDLKNLSAGFALDACRAFDLFPQTAHVETVVTPAGADPPTDAARRQPCPADSRLTAPVSADTILCEPVKST